MDFINLLRAIAAILITNSHFDLLYPPGLSALATGGSIGNAVFFFCSGYVLFLSKKQSFPSWFLRRIARLYPSMLIFLLVTSLVGYPWKIVDFIIPPYWFIQAIIVFYLPFYWISKYLSKQLTLICLLCYAVFVFVFFLYPHHYWLIDDTTNPTRLYWYYYFSIMLLGAICAQNGSAFIAKSRLVCSGMLVLSIALFYCFVLFAQRSSEYSDFQIVYPLLLAFLAYSAYSAARSFTTKVKEFCGPFSKAIVCLSKITLEIYIVQFVIIDTFTQYAFPFGFLAAAISILLAALVLHTASEAAMTKLRLLLGKKAEKT